MISIVIPTYNEQDAINHTISEIHVVCEKSQIEKYEIIIVNDGSKDDTEKYANASDATVVNHPHNLGYGRSLKTGIRKAKYDTIVITDADCTYPFYEMPKLLEQYNRGFDMVIGARHGKHYKESIIKSLLRKVLKFLVEFTVNRNVDDVNSGLRIFSKKTIEPCLNNLCDTFSFTTSLTLAYMMTGKFVKYIPIKYDKRAGKTKVKLIRDSLRTLLYIVQAINYYNPLKLFILFFLLCIGFSCIGFLGSIFFNLKSGFLLGIGGLLVSIIIISCGLVSDNMSQALRKSM